MAVAALAALVEAEASVVALLEAAVALAAVVVVLEAVDTYSDIIYHKFLVDFDCFLYICFLQL